MFNYIRVDFPEAFVSPKMLFSARIYQSRYEHEIMVLKYRDWGVEYENIVSGSPVQAKISGTTDSRNFYGYVHHLKVDRTPGGFFTEIVVIGASFLMKQQHLELYKDRTADSIVKELADKYNFACFTVPHKRVFPQVTQSGITDWQLMVKLAKQVGYTLRTQNTELYFEPIMYDYTYRRSQAPYFMMRHEGHEEGSTIYNFEARIGDSLPYEDSVKAAVAVNGLDFNTVNQITNTKQARNKKMKVKERFEFFDRFDTSTVVRDSSTAEFEAEAAEDRNAFPYRAVVEVLGEPNLRPDMPVFLNGLDFSYNGYWVILSTEHIIQETEKDVQTYTTRLYVGTDSLGQANVWIDGALIMQPSYVASRTIVPGVRQTNVMPQSYLATTSAPTNSKNMSSLGAINNRAKLGNNGSVWKTSTPNITGQS